MAPRRDSDSRTGRGAFLRVLLAAALMAPTAGCGRDRAAPTPVGELPVSSASALAPQPRRTGIWPADQWPDACALAADAVPVATARPVPSPGTAPDGYRLAGAAACTWSRDAGPLRLEVLLVTEDVEEAWEGFTYQNLARRDVSGVGELAFLAGDGLDRDGLWVCQGRTIFVVTSPSGDSARQDLLAVAGAAVASLRELSAGVPVAG